VHYSRWEETDFTLPLVRARPEKRQRVETVREIEKFERCAEKRADLGREISPDVPAATKVPASCQIYLATSPRRAARRFEKGSNNPSGVCAFGQKAQKTWHYRGHARLAERFRRQPPSWTREFDSRTPLCSVVLPVIAQLDNGLCRVATRRLERGGIRVEPVLKQKRIVAPRNSGTSSWLRYRVLLGFQNEYEAMAGLNTHFFAFFDWPFPLG
jgi:hypothetical protein